MATLGLIEYKDASPEVRAVYDDIMATRKTERSRTIPSRLSALGRTLSRLWLRGRLMR
jgi:hypothetical protein